MCQHCDTDGCGSGEARPDAKRNVAIGMAEEPEFLVWGCNEFFCVSRYNCSFLNKDGVGKYSLGFWAVVVRKRQLLGDFFPNSDSLGL